MQTVFDQLVLDSICDRVDRRIAPGLVGCSVGKRDPVAADAAETLKASVDDVQAAISRLIRRGLLRDAVDEIVLRHQAWLEWSRFNPRVVAARWGFESLEDWFAWDGIAVVTPTGI
jgi:hypothetical protein